MLHLGYDKMRPRTTAPIILFANLCTCAAQADDAVRPGKWVFSAVVSEPGGAARDGIGVKRPSAQRDSVHYVRQPASAYGMGAVHPTRWVPTMQDRPNQCKWRYCQLVYDLRHAPDHDQRRRGRALPWDDIGRKIHGSRRYPGAPADRQDDAGDGPLSRTVRRQVSPARPT